MKENLKKYCLDDFFLFGIFINDERKWRVGY